MFNLFNRIPKGYVETVDGYLIKESEAKKVTVDGKATYYRKEKAPTYDKVTNYISWGVICKNFYKNNVEVKEDGTPIGYHTPEEVQKLKDRIKELEDKYEPTTTDSKIPISRTIGLLNEMCGVFIQTKDNRNYHKTKRKNGKRSTKKNPKGAGRPKKTI